MDFIGIPKNYTRPDGKEVFTIIPPEHFSGSEEIQAIFFDEINRADEKTLNAIMELIQFKSINGRKFPHLKCIWAAENPAEDADAEYSVHPLDPAQKDRFHIQLDFPNSLNSKYFVEKYGKDIYDVASNWWTPNKKKMSPRKLDDILSGFVRGFDIEDFSNTINLKELKFSLENINVFETLLAVSLNSSDKEKADYFTLDRLRKYSKNIKAKSRHPQYNEMIDGFYDLLDDEVKKFVMKQFAYSPKRITNLPEKTNTFLFEHRHKTKSPLKFNEMSGGAFESYITDFIACVDSDALPNCNDYSGFRFPFIYDKSFSTNQIRAFIVNVNYSNGMNQRIKAWLVRALYMLNHSLVNPAETECYKVINKLTGNADFNKRFGINKIFYNELKKNKRLYGLSEINRRLFV